ncbi:Mitochondrial basic amino acids transporter [Folsomia candida]|uniref:Mitochondrial basic amino acids transporter n=2 Tax=Folsomia candida TaxID=158441 RepID=A0A226ESI4_FOLCA|nr:Mitochondrial basic amino acids transporter [Folsomia candida]
MAGISVGHPIDTVKVRQQIETGSLIRTIAYIRSHGGIFAFFRGMGAPLLTNGVINSVYFGFYGGSLDQIVRWRYEQDSQDKSTYAHKHEAFYSEHFAAGCIGGLAQLCIGCPVDLVKVQLQSRLQKAEVKGPVDCVKQIIKTHGIFGLYKGIVPQFFRDVPASGGYFVIYEFSKRTLGSGDQQSNKLVQFVAGGIAGMLSWWSILPLDVIKSRVQGDCPHNPQYKGMIHCATIIWKSQGVRGLFRGFLPLSLRAFLVNGTTFLVYEHLFQHCREHHHKNNGNNNCNVEISSIMNNDNVFNKDDF